MRLIDATLQSRLDSGVTTTCLCWKLTRKDAFILGVTEHDKPLSYNGQVYVPNGAMQPAAFTTSSGLKPGHSSATGALSHSAITEQDIQAGLWDEARIDVYRVDWLAPDLGFHVWSGHFTEIRHGQSGFEVDLVSLKAELERTIGRIFSRHCDAKLGDARCGINLNNLQFSGLTCDQNFSTCQNSFQNTDNFRGFPHMPGNDFVLSGPNKTGNNGGKR